MQSIPHRVSNTRTKGSCLRASARGASETICRVDSSLPEQGACQPAHSNHHSHANYVHWTPPPDT
ncbi:hypothetical protein L484_002551 [Morus notabilis]|uniref:Uncharacterized protein n=1 Tax=Morus notabilis TaxID=981085 RepID=W9RUP7_9ROSA|nr:hypothetical protein L484_002551 [Morus notabilis]